MARKEVVDAVEGYLAAEWDDCPVIAQNTLGEAPEDGSPFIMVQYPVSSTDRFSVGTRYYREEGGVRFILHLPRGEGTRKALEWSDRLADLFRDKKFGGVEFKVPASPFMDDSNDNGSYFVATIVVPYAFNFSDEVTP